MNYKLRWQMRAHHNSRFSILELHVVLLNLQRTKTVKNAIYLMDHQKGACLL